MFKVIVWSWKEKAQGDLTDVHKSLIGVCKGDGASLSSKMCTEWTRGNGHKLEYKKFCLNIKKKKKTSFTVVVIEEWDNLPEEFEEYLKIFKTQVSKLLYLILL